MPEATEQRLPVWVDDAVTYAVDDLTLIRELADAENLREKAADGWAETIHDRAEKALAHLERDNDGDEPCPPDIEFALSQVRCLFTAMKAISLAFMDRQTSDRGADDLVGAILSVATGEDAADLLGALSSVAKQDSPADAH